MLDASILQILKMFPKGTTDGQLLFRLGSGGMRNDPSAVLAALVALTDRGEVWRDGDRWRAAEQPHFSSPGQERAGSLGRTTTVGETLVAVPASFRARTVESEKLVEDASEMVAMPWRAALSYYASTQRQDPRGQVERFPDQHGASWQLFAARGPWWGDGALSIQASDLPGTFREALARAGHKGTAAVGWPVTVVPQATGTPLMPGLLLPATWVLGEATLLVTVDSVPPVINPAWMRAMRRWVGGRVDQITEAILGSDEGSDLGSVAHRLAHAFASVGGALLKPADLSRELALSGNGLRNAAALILPDEAAFTRRVAEDLDVIAEMEPGRRRGTALSALIEPSAAPLEESESTPLVALNDLSDAQAAAADAALIGPVTAIQGPPGTGKSQTIASLIVSAIAAGQSVLFVARNHRALDEVEHRLADVFPDIPILTRGSSADGEQNVNFFDALRTLAQGAAADPDEELQARAAREAVLAAATQGGTARARVRETERLHLILSDLADRALGIREALPPGVMPRRHSLLARLWVMLRRLWSRPSDDPVLPQGATLGEIESRMRELRLALEKSPALNDEGLRPNIEILRAIARATVRPDSGTLHHLGGRLADLEFQMGGSKVARLTAEDASLILRHRPIWAISSLSVPARVPLIPALFDLAIFDEASQADIASSLPVLVRAKRAVIVGDPQQLSFIPGLGREQEHALMDAAGMPKSGRARWAQSVNSLFDFAAHRLNASQRHILTDQFRSAPEIVDYTSAAFYGGKLNARREDEAFRPPKGYRPGLHWENVKGTAGREDGGNINVAEADWIANRLVELVGDDSFDGSVGVISPFNAQVGLIRRRVEARVSVKDQERLKLHVDTVDRWQGGEADVVFFSMVAGSGAASSATTFLSRERRRFNVAISRARAVAVVVGDLDWARSSRIAHIADLADRATNPRPRPQRGFDSLWERRVDTALRARGLAPHPQYAVGRRSLDFALFEGAVKLDLEVDGVRFHTGADGSRKTSDRLRDRELIGKGWKVRRFWVWEFERNMEGCIDAIERDLGRR